MKLWAKVLVGFLSFIAVSFVAVVFYQLTRYFYDIEGPAKAKMHITEQLRIQEDAQLALKTLYTNLNAFKSANGFYTTDLVAIGMQSISPNRYKFGFPTSFESTSTTRDIHLDPSRKDSESLFAAEDLIELFPKYVEYRDFKIDHMANYFCPNCHLDNDSFKAIAFANIDDDDTWDVWTIDETGGLSCVSNDTAD